MPVINTNIAETTTITENGTYDVARYTTAVVNTPVAPNVYIEYLVSGSSVIKNIPETFNFCVNTVSTNVLTGLFSYGVFSNPVFHFDGCIFATSELNNLASYSNIKEFHFDILKKCSGNGKLSNAFFSASNLEKVYFHSLEIMEAGNGLQNIFAACSKLEYVYLDKFTTIDCIQTAPYMFQNASKIKSFTFHSLNKIGLTVTSQYGPFAYFLVGSSLENIYFPAVNSSTFGTGNYNKGLSNFGTSYNKSITLHFPKNLDPQSGSTVISSLDGYPTFGNNNTVLLFDLPSTNYLIGVNTITYERSPKDDIETALAWRKNEYDSNGLVVDWTPYYTSGTTDPQVGGTIYSDSACTTTVTTISSIA